MTASTLQPIDHTGLKTGTAPHADATHRCICVG
jgi:hypothetical protein